MYKTLKASLVKEVLKLWAKLIHGTTIQFLWSRLTGARGIQ